MIEYFKEQLEELQPYTEDQVKAFFVRKNEEIDLSRIGKKRCFYIIESKIQNASDDEHNFKLEMFSEWEDYLESALTGHTYLRHGGTAIPIFRSC